jgi:GTPase SAR1 family protein
MYQNYLSALEKIRSTCKTTKIKLPQIVVIGDQSAGKSSLLGQISGIPFPVDSKICTRCPIIVYTRFDATTSFTINDTAVKFDELRSTIASGYERFGAGRFTGYSTHGREFNGDGDDKKIH